MATITFLENAAFTDASARNWLGWRHEVASTDFTTLADGTRVYHYGIYNLQTNFTDDWAGWYISYLGPQAFTGSFPHPHPAFPLDHNQQHSHAAGGITDRFFIREFGVGAFLEVTGLSVDLTALGNIHPAGEAYAHLPTWEAKVTAAYNDYTAAMVQAFGGGNDTFNGSSRADLIHGYGGDDTVIGNGGNDTIDGGVGFDALHGGAGDDVYILNDATGTSFDTIVEGRMRASTQFTSG